MEIIFWCGTSRLAEMYKGRRMIMNVQHKVRSFLEHSRAILSSFKIVVIFNNTSADFVLISADVNCNVIFLIRKIDSY